MWILTSMNQITKKSFLQIATFFFDWQCLSYNPLSGATVISHDCTIKTMAIHSCLQITHACPPVTDRQTDTWRPASDPCFFPWSCLTVLSLSHGNLVVLLPATSPLERLGAGFTSWFSGLSLVHERLLNYEQVSWSWGSPQSLRLKPGSLTNSRKLPAEGTNSINMRALQHWGMYL